MKAINKYFLSAMVIAFLTINVETFAQVGIGTTNPDTSSMLDIQSNAKGVLIPRMLTSDRTAISTPANGLLVFDTDTKSFWFRDGSTWKELVSGGNYVDLTTNQTVAGMKTFTGNLTPAGRLMLPMGEISYFKTAGFNLIIANTATGQSGLLTNDNMVKIDPGTINTNFIDDNFGTGTDSRLTYTGATTRLFHIALSFSYYPENLKDSYIFAVAKNGLVQETSKLFITTGASGDFQSSAMHVLLELKQNEYIEFWVGNLTTANKYIKIKSFNFVAIGM